MRVVKNYLYNVGYQVLAIIVPLITSYYVSRVLSPEGVGANAFTNSIIQYFMLLANIGIGYYGNREIAYVRDNKQKMAETFWEIQIVKTVMTVVAYLSFVVFMAFYSGNKTYMWAQSINLLAVAFDISWLYQGLEDFKRTVLRNTFVKITSMIAIFIFIKSPKDVALYIIVLALSTLLGNLTLWPHAVNNYGHVDRGTKLNPWRHFVPTVTMFVPQIATQLYVQLNRTMLGLMVDQKASGFYQYSDNLVKLILAFVTATGTVMLPHVANAFAQHDMEKVHKMLYKSFDFVSALAYPMMFGIAGVSMTLAPLYYSFKYAPVGPAMLIESNHYSDDRLVQRDRYPVPAASQPGQGLYDFRNSRGRGQHHHELPADPPLGLERGHVVNGFVRNLGNSLPAFRGQKVTGHQKDVCGQLEVPALRDCDVCPGLLAEHAHEGQLAVDAGGSCSWYCGL